MQLVHFRRLVSVLGLVILLATTSWPAGAIRAADDSNIPGVPLPGSVVTGKLGGPVYDRVYEMNVPADRVILLSLAGDAGTDFDLYLFDGSAATIYDTSGQVAFSTGSTSTESITYPTQAGGTFYIDLNGASDVEGNFRLTVKMLADTTPPTVRLLLDGGAEATQDSTIQVSVIANDDLAGVTDVEFSTDGDHWDGWRDYAPSSLWTFPQVDGPRSLFVRVRDRVGNVSPRAAATIVIDTVEPAVVSRSPGPGDDFTTLRPTVRVQFSERIDATTWSPAGFVLQAADGTLVPGTYSYDAAETAATFIPATDLAPGTVYVATLSGITDLAGNALPSVGSWVVTPLLASGPTVSLSPAAVDYGAVVMIQGHVALSAADQVTIERSIAGRPWQILGVVTPDSEGFISARTVASANAQYRLHVARSSTHIEQLSDRASLVVRRKVALAGVASSTTRVVSPGFIVPLTAVTTPSNATTITFTIYRYDAAHRRYVVVAKSNRAAPGGRASYNWRVTAGRYYVRVSTPATDLLTAGVSASYRWLIP